ncbi:MAG TPA: hypothetical protein VK842_01385 [bacterium]|nr:hypothetical protein [bacterium]
MKLLCLATLVPPAAGHAWQEDWSKIPAGHSLAKDDGTWNVPEAKFYVIETDSRLGAKAARWRPLDLSSAALYDQRLFAGDQSMSATAALDPHAASKGAVLYLCSSPLCPGILPCQGYAFLFRPKDGGTILRLVSGTTQALAPAAAYTPKHWGHVRLNAARTGNRLTLSVDGHLVASAVDAAYPSGFAGFGVNRGGPDSAAIGALSFQADRSEDAKPSLFQPHASNPVLSPALPWEMDAVYEPNVIASAGSYLMSYTGGWGMGRTAIGIAHSMDGVHWVRQDPSPALGLGHGGEDGAAMRSSLLKVGDGYRLYYADGPGNLRLATSPDGVHFQRQERIVIPHDADPNVTHWASQGFVREGRTWWALVDGEYPSGILWRLNLFQSGDDGLTFHQAAGPLDSLRVGYGSFGSPRPLRKLGGLYHVWYLIAWNSLRGPTVLWHATSPDLRQWTPDPFRTLGIPGSEMGLAKPDQVADPDLLEMNDSVYLYYDADDNSHGAARIGLAVHPGNLKQLVSSYETWSEP